MNDRISILKFGRTISLVTGILTFATFTIAILTPPLSGPWCLEGCFEYPFTEITERFPRDYYWMFSAIVLSFIYIMFVASIHFSPSNDRKLYSSIAMIFGVMSALLLSTDYFIQVTVIQPSLLSGETEGISLISQFNPHGIFIALEELGFFLMVFSLFFFFPVFHEKNGNQIALKWTAILGLILAIVAFVTISLQYGIMREYRFEIAIISIAWIQLIVFSFLSTRYFSKQLKSL